MSTLIKLSEAFAAKEVKFSYPVANSLPEVWLKRIARRLYLISDYQAEFDQAMDYLKEGRSLDGLYPEKVAAAYLGVSPSTLRYIRANGTGPDYEKRGRSAWYRQEQLEAFAKDKPQSQATE